MGRADWKSLPVLRWDAETCNPVSKTALTWLNFAHWLKLADLILTACTSRKVVGVDLILSYTTLYYTVDWLFFNYRFIPSFCEAFWLSGCKIHILAISLAMMVNNEVGGGGIAVKELDQHASNLEPGFES